MAKKDPIELSVEEKLKTLYQLQTSLSEIDEKRALRGELPLEVQDLEDEVRSLSLVLQFFLLAFPLLHESLERSHSTHFSCV